MFETLKKARLLAPQDDETQGAGGAAAPTNQGDDDTDEDDDEDLRGQIARLQETVDSLSGMLKEQNKNQGDEEDDDEDDEEEEEPELPEGVDKDALNKYVDHRWEKLNKEQNKRLQQTENTLNQQSLNNELNAYPELKKDADAREKVAKMAINQWKSGAAEDMKQAVEFAAKISGVAQAAPPKPKNSDAQKFRQRSRGKGNEPTQDELAAMEDDAAMDAILDNHKIGS